MTHERFTGKVLHEGQVICDRVEGFLNFESTGKLYSWRGTMLVPGATPRDVLDLFERKGCELQIHDGRRGEFFVHRARIDSSGDHYMEFQGTGPFERPA